jgi:hypothetical protein
MQAEARADRRLPKRDGSPSSLHRQTRRTSQACGPALSGCPGAASKAHAAARPLPGGDAGWPREPWAPVCSARSFHLPLRPRRTRSAASVWELTGPSIKQLAVVEEGQGGRATVGDTVRSSAPFHQKEEPGEDVGRIRWARGVAPASRAVRARRLPDEPASHQALARTLSPALRRSSAVCRRELPSFSARTWPQESAPLFARGRSLRRKSLRNPAVGAALARRT